MFELKFSVIDLGIKSTLSQGQGRLWQRVNPMVTVFRVTLVSTKGEVIVNSCIAAYDPIHQVSLSQGPSQLHVGAICLPISFFEQYSCTVQYIKGRWYL